MAPQLNNEAEKQKKVDEDVRETISALSRRLGAIRQDDEEEASIITLAGSNVGATMRGAMDDKLEAADEEESAASYAVNSNFQAVNNSVMLGGSFETNDPGVHLDITDNRGTHRHVQRAHDNVTDAHTHTD